MGILNEWLVVRRTLPTRSGGLEAAEPIAKTASTGDGGTDDKTKTGLEQAAHGLEASLQWEALAQPITLATEDLQEGVSAAREKRPPVFRGV